MITALRSYFESKTNVPVRIAIVGGPQAGKSTAFREIEKIFGTHRIVTVDETATRFFSAGLTKAPTDPAKRRAWLKRLQPAIFAVQAMRELDALDIAEETGAKVIFFDRGVHDTIAYLGGLEPFNELFPELTPDSLHPQYDVVIYLESLATANPELFGTLGNETRYESLEEAQAVEYATRAAWE